MKLIIFTRECLLDHLIKMTEDEMEKYIMNHLIFSLSDRWLMYINLQNTVLFFCLRSLNIVRPFVRETVFCIKRSDLFNDTCLDLADFSGISNFCQNCIQLLITSLKKYLIKLKK